MRGPNGPSRLRIPQLGVLEARGIGSPWIPSCRRVVVLRVFPGLRRLAEEGQKPKRALLMIDGTRIRRDLYEGKIVVGAMRRLKASHLGEIPLGDMLWG